MVRVEIRVLVSTMRDRLMSLAFNAVDRIVMPSFASMVVSLLGRAVMRWMFSPTMAIAVSPL